MYNSLEDNRVEERIEGRRGCGYRDSRGVYLVGPIHGTPCCKLPIKLGDVVSVFYTEQPSQDTVKTNMLVYNWRIDGEPIQFSQSHRYIANPQEFWKYDKCVARNLIGCPLGVPDAIPNALLIWVGEQHYPTALDFALEAQTMGVSRKLRGLPAEFVLGETWVLLAHRKTIPISPIPDLYEKKDITHLPAIFKIFKPIAVEKVVDGTETEEDIEALIAKGITPVKITRKDELDESAE